MHVGSGGDIAGAGPRESTRPTLPHAQECPAMKALEFYSGIGGLHYALGACVPEADVTAFEISDLANDVYEHNFGRRPQQKNIGRLTAQQLDKWGANAWLLSPPCQPYTRRGLKKQSADERAVSFLSLLELLPQLKRPPKYLLVENVVGFETSDTRDVLVETLQGAGYEMQEFIVTPRQLGIPYSRPRYFALAKRGAFALPTPPEGAGPFRLPPSRLLAQRSAQAAAGSGAQHEAAACTSSSSAAAAAALPAEEVPGRPLEEFLVTDPALELEGGVRAKLPPNWILGHKRAAECFAAEAAANGAAAAAGAAGSSSGGADCERQPDEQQPDEQQEQQQQQGQGQGQGSNDPWAAFRVPADVIRKHGWCFDLVGPDSTTSNCFTKTYAQYVKGSGSLIATRNLHILQQLREQQQQQQQQGQELPDGASNAAAAGAAGVATMEGDQENLDVQQQANGGQQAQQEQDGEAQEQQRRQQQQEQQQDEQQQQLYESLLALGLRYFTPREIANLHSFPPEFSFPPTVTLRQRYSMLGNSLSVAVVEDLLRYLLAEPDQ